MVGRTGTSSTHGGKYRAGTASFSGDRPHRSPDFAALMFDALDNAFGALGHPDPIDHLRRLAAARRSELSCGRDEAAGMAELSYDFATDILVTASHYAALLESLRRQQAESPPDRPGDEIAA